MGGSKWSSESYEHIRSDYSSKSREKIFTSETIDAEMDPKNIKLRESRDSEAHPRSVGIKLDLDDTGSMGSIPEMLIKHKLGTLMDTLIKHGVEDAHVLFGAVGDQYSDKYPLQVGQFEAGTQELDKWLTHTYLEGGGGPGDMESYPLTWFFNSRHTSMDCFEKRGEKGFHFTCGDERFHPVIDRKTIKKVMGYDIQEDLSSLDALKESQRTFNVFHLHVLHDGRTDRHSSIVDAWQETLGQNLIIVDDYNMIAEIIATTVAVIRGADLAHVTKDFDSRTADAVSSALVKVSSSVTKTNKGAMHL